ncbi:unnamed protein product [Diabrotica balteata]|uniref:ZAD domain-containing protein n=1 Tax=Diabrotica balteata TaxID=107213 RepID=A0A9P0DWB5_DIABA|nr:unnamed protein product [Diabrotica balteata]
MDTICRLCLRNNDKNMKNIFKEFMSESVYFTFGVQIKASDKFSKLICQQCINQLECVRELKTFYQKNQQYLQQKKCPPEFDSEEKKSLTYHSNNSTYLDVSPLRLETTNIDKKEDMNAQLEFLKCINIFPLKTATIKAAIPIERRSKRKRTPKFHQDTSEYYNIQDNVQSEKHIEQLNGLVPVVELSRLGDITEEGYKKISNYLYKKTSKKNPIQHQKKSIQDNSKLKSKLPFSVGKKVTANNSKHILNFIQRQKSKLDEYEEVTAVNRQCDVDEITSKTNDPAKICDINGDISSKVNKTIIMKQAEKSDKTDDVLSKTSKIITDENSYVNNQKLVMRDVLRECQKNLNLAEDKSTDQTTTVITIDDDQVPVHENLSPVKITSKTNDPAKMCDINGDSNSKVNKTIIMKQAEKSDKTDSVLSKTSKITTDENSYVNNQKLVMRDVLRESQKILNLVEDKSTDHTSTVITIDDDQASVNENLPPYNNQNTTINVTRGKTDISRTNIIPEQFLVPVNDTQVIAMQDSRKTNAILPQIQVINIDDWVQDEIDDTVWIPKSVNASETLTISANNKDLHGNTLSALVPVLSRLGDITDEGYTKRSTYLYKKTSKENLKQHQKKSSLHEETQKSYLVSEVNLQPKSKLPFLVEKQVTVNNCKYVPYFIGKENLQFGNKSSTDVNRKRDAEKITSNTNKKLKICDINSDINSKVNKSIILNQAVKSDKADVLSNTRKSTIAEIKGKMNILGNTAISTEDQLLLNYIQEKRNSVHNKKLVMRDVLIESKKNLNFVGDKSMDDTTVITIDDDDAELNKNLPPNNNHNTPINPHKSYISSNNIIPEKLLLPDSDVQITLVTKSQKSNPIVPHVQTIHVDDGMQDDTNDTAWKPNSFELPETLLFSPNDKESILLRERKKSDIQTWKKIQKYLHRVILLGNSDIKKQYKRVLEMSLMS